MSRRLAAVVLSPDTAVFARSSSCLFVTSPNPSVLATAFTRKSAANFSKRSKSVINCSETSGLHPNRDASPVIASAPPIIAFASLENSRHGIPVAKNADPPKLSLSLANSFASKRSALMPTMSDRLCCSASKASAARSAIAAARASCLVSRATCFIDTSSLCNIASSSSRA